MKYYIIAGEASGDLHASRLMHEIKQTDKEADFRYTGGDLMAAEGGVLFKHYKEMAVMGFVRVILHLGKVLGNIRAVERDIKAYRPDGVILVDYPSFNLRVAEYVKRHIGKNVPVYFYISPKIWAWKEWRMKSIRKYIDHIFCILPFEKKYYEERWNYKVTYVGNPTLDEIENRRCKEETKDEFTFKNNLSGKEIIAILAGSRKQEIVKCLPVMMKAVEAFPTHQFVIAGAPGADKKLYEKYLYKNPRFNVVFGQTYALLQQSKAAVINSGTASLEAALLGVPQVVGYHVVGGKLARFLLSKMIRVKWASLVNLIGEREIVKEYLADEMTAKNLQEELRKIINDKAYRAKMLDGYDDVKARLGAVGASRQAAEAIVERLRTDVTEGVK